MRQKFFDTPMMPRLITILREMKEGTLVVEPIEVKEENKLAQCEFLNSIIDGYPIGDFVTWRFSGDGKTHVFGKDSHRLSFLFQVFYGDLGIHFDAEKCSFICEKNENTVPTKSFFCNRSGECLFDQSFQLRTRGRPELARRAENAANIIRDMTVLLHPAVTNNLDEVLEAVRLREKKWEF